MNHTEPLTAQEIIDEIRGRILDIQTHRKSGMVNGDFKKRLLVRELALQSVSSWITGQNQMREAERAT